jgi:ATP-binding cassette, subfamily B, heavy metal transporter
MIQKDEDGKEYKIDFKYNLKLYWEIISKYKGLIFGLLILILLIEAGTVFDRYLFKIVIDQGTAFAGHSITHNAFVNILLIVGIVFVALAVLKAIIRWFHLHLINVMDANVALDIKNKFLNHLLHLSYNFHTTHKTGSLISKLIRSGSAVERMTDTLVFNFVPLVFQLIVITISINYFDSASAIAIMIVSVVFLVYSFLINQKQQASNILANEAEDLEKANISDIFTNIESIKYYGKEKVIKEKYGAIGETTKQALLKNYGYYRWLSGGQQLILGIGTFFVMYFPVIAVLDGKMTIGTLVFIYTVFAAMLGNLFGFDHGIRNFYRSMADFEALFKYYKVENDIKDKPEAKELVIGDGTIEFRNISFKYKNRPIFSNFNLKIPKNKKIAVIGPSGSGKTSLIRVLYRLYDVEEGEVLIDGKNVKDFKQESLRSSLSIVPQECVLFDESIFNNISFSKPGATKKEVFQAMKFAQLDKIVNEFPNKEDTIVGERGVKLSGGEKQRVSIARAILANKKILVLDEATSSLDSETESEIQKDLQRLMEGRTAIIIAHRLSTIMRADTIVVLDRGKIVQTGTHKELIRKEGMYKRLWNLQKGGYIE